VRKFRYPRFGEKDAERRNDPPAEICAARILTRAHEKAVLDAVDARFKALVDAEAAIGVRRYLETEQMAFLDARRKLLARHYRKRRISVNSNKAAVKNLDEVRSCTMFSRIAALIPSAESSVSRLGCGPERLVWMARVAVTTRGPGKQPASTSRR
jgi:hypothetical protein